MVDKMLQDNSMITHSAINSLLLYIQPIDYMQFK